MRLALLIVATTALFPAAPRIRAAAETGLASAQTREAILGGRPILFVVRHQYRADHHNTATMFQTGEINAGSFDGGGALKVVRPGEKGEAGTILETKHGVLRDPDVSFDGRRILFSMRRNPRDDFHVYEIGADGTGLRQLTFGEGLSDIDPIYLPDDRILFVSTREPKYCMCNRHIMGNLFTMDADGANVQQIGHSTLHEGHPSLLSDGRVIYDRWEYVDRNFGDAQGVWSVYPDGTGHAIHWGNNTNSPGGVLDAREIPWAGPPGGVYCGTAYSRAGHSAARHLGRGLFVATFSSCHDRPWGAIAIVDRTRGLDGRGPVIRTWPPGAIELVGVGDYDTFKRVRPRYEDPYPLSERHFLASRTTGEGEEMGIYLLDALDPLEGDTLLHREAPGCFDPMPLGTRVRPPALPSRVDLAAGEGTLYVQDVYEGGGMEAIPRGSVRALRVVESPEKRTWTRPAWDGGTGQQAPGMAWDDFNNKRILGTVPVEPDGSAYLVVPADTFLYFQLLDERGMMVQSMRSGTIVRPGETLGCVGCHDDRRTTALAGRRGTAWSRPPSRLEPWYGPARLFSYAVEVQPVLDRRCVPCHDRGSDAGGTLDLSGDVGLIFNASYIELRRKGLVKVVGAGPHEVQPPKSWGSHASRLAKVLLEGHGDPAVESKVRLDREDLDRIITWIDINAPYYPVYASSFPENLYGRSPLDEPLLSRLSELTGLNLRDRSLCGHVNFTRPELSLCLDGLSDEGRRREALEIIGAGAEALRAAPRPELPGFRLTSPAEVRQEERYQARLRDEAAGRSAILTGEKLYPGSP